MGETALSAGSVVVAPRGQTVQSMLGLPADAAPDRIGRAISQLEQSKAPEGYQSQYSFQPDGSLNVTYFNKEGDVAPNTYSISPQAVRQRMDE
ncbi:hypothetical protein, partial [Staphylococcus aureus]|uniref:hypothetical protein n=1 Tax=Staphylococcus aureus TaxID=1280 RepID=UPI00301B895B